MNDYLYDTFCDKCLTKIEYLQDLVKIHVQGYKTVKEMKVCKNCVAEVKKEISNEQIKARPLC